MICIKKKRLSNIVVPSSNTLESNNKNCIPAISNQISSSNNETETGVPNCKRKSNKNCHTNFQTNSNESSVAEYIENLPNSTDAQEVIDIYSEISL
jgi:hypothetical protein